MRKLLLSLLLAFSIVSFAQDNPVQSPSMQDAAGVAADSTPPIEIRDSEASRRNMEGLLELSAQQKKRREVEKRNAYIRIGIGVLMLVVLVIGWRRRKK